MGWVLPEPQRVPPGCSGQGLRAAALNCSFRESRGSSLETGSGEAVGSAAGTCHGHRCRFLPLSHTRVPRDVVAAASSATVTGVPFP